ncbi:MAG: DUF5011 domain-containing protein [Patescibacteria group bacterium]|nr:DUF5011 domain-containing protein [Patescibacteria group bacterium]
MKKNSKNSLKQKALRRKVAYIFMAAIFVVNFCSVYAVLADDQSADSASTQTSASNGESSSESSVSAGDAGTADSTADSAANSSDSAATSGDETAAPAVESGSEAQSENTSENTNGSSEAVADSENNSQPENTIVPNGSENTDTPASSDADLNSADSNNDSPATDANGDQTVTNEEPVITELPPIFEELVKVVALDLPPVITLNGSATVNLTVDDLYTDAGATAIDDLDGDITLQMITENNVWTHVAGTYTVDYYSTDSANQTTTASRTVIVAPKDPNNAPVAAAQSVNVKRNTGIKITLKGADADQNKNKRGNEIWPFNINNFEIVDQPMHGSLTNFNYSQYSTYATVIYLPSSGYVGADSFTFRVQDNNNAWSEPATISITVNPSTICTFGDLTGDNRIDANDANAGAVMVLKVGPPDLSADLDGNGDISSSDITMIKSLIARHAQNPAVSDEERGNCNPTADVTYSKDGGSTFSGSAVVDKNDTLKIVAKFSKTVPIHYKIYLSIDNGLLVNAEMQNSRDGYSYDFAVPASNVALAKVSIILSNDANDIGANITSGSSFTIYNESVNYGGSGGGGSSTIWCESVSYGDWTSCSAGRQTRLILSQTPDSCQLTDSQSAATEQTCTVTPVPPIENQGSINEESQISGGQVLGVKIWEIGSLIRTPDFKIFVVRKNMSLWHIKTLKELWEKYRGLTIWNVPFENLTPYVIINK